MKVEIEITKKDLRDILCSAMRNYYCNIKMHLDTNINSPWQHLTKKYDEDITDNLYDIRDACDAISNLCDMIEEVDTVEPNDACGVICFEDSEGEKK